MHACYNLSFEVERWKRGIRLLRIGRAEVRGQDKFCKEEVWETALKAGVFNLQDLMPDDLRWS